MVSEVSPLKGKVALVTGGRRGIGKAITLAFAGAGADVAFCALNDDDKLAAVAEEVHKLGRYPLALKADVTVKADVEMMVRRVIDAFGRIDILVNGAGLWSAGTFVDPDEDSWDRVLDVNLKSAYLCNKVAGKVMIQQKRGNIINFASRLGINPVPGVGAYAVAKAAVIMLTRQLALELAKYNIRVNAIAPGIVKTDMNIRIRPTLEAERQIASRVVLNRLVCRLREASKDAKIGIQALREQYQP